MMNCRILLTLKCNFKCKYCCNNIPEVKETFQKIKYENLLSKLSVYDSISITGGEPFLHPNMEQYIQEIKKCNQ